MEKEDKVQERLNAIEDLIRTYPIEDQEALAELLKKEYGIEVHQSIISKDLRRLGISKQKVGEIMIYELPSTDATREILRRAVLEIKHNESLIVIKTLPGLSDFVGDFVDAHAHLGILGTIAGENTVFIAPKSIKKIDHLFKDLNQLMHIKIGTNDNE